ncbi:MAG: ABC transporter permease [Selenomonadaceae bacterium]|nr:ABC transporter permease [Selenomonadaceae bacterium]MBP3723409.1 ABC transporter permease [Selenomonadaceae bacterium]
MKFLETIGKITLDRLTALGAVTLLYFESMRHVFKKPRFSSIINQMSHLGVDSLMIVTLTLTFTGVVMTLQTAAQFIKFGAESTLGAVIGIAIGRELGPVLVGIVCAGRVGSAITAEISTMKVTEQIDALKVMAVNPIDYLIVPRMIACMIVVPILTIFGDIIGVLGGLITAVFYSGVSSVVFFNSIEIYCNSFDITGGVIKAVFFGSIIAVLGCYYGLNSPNGAEGVGKATTKTVVSSIIAIFVFNALLTFVLF